MTTRHKEQGGFQRNDRVLAEVARIKTQAVARETQEAAGSFSGIHEKVSPKELDKRKKIQM
ncbi:MAG: hypothetical protein NTU61_05445 [Candidatus Altiarchaeota archaeon]|nr:hypothetical protein [Candidatus Altiarchaeota archaeon]